MGCEIETGRLQRFGRLVSLSTIIAAFAIFIVVDATSDVKAYLAWAEDDLPEADRPGRCRRCASDRRPHKHGRFWRIVFTRSGWFRIPVCRFRCPDCKGTMSLPPDFVEAHHQTAVDVKEEVVRLSSEGHSLSEIAEQSKNGAGGGYAEKTLWRWRRCWEQRRRRHEQQLWTSLVHQGLDGPLPRERKSPWRALFASWPQPPHRPPSLFTALLRLDRSQTLSVR